jgi:hypothetical protein
MSVFKRKEEYAAINHEQPEQSASLDAPFQD